MKVLKSLFVQCNFTSPSFRNYLSLNEAEKMIASKLKCPLLAAYRGFAHIFGTLIALITLAGKLLLEIMKTEFHFLSWIYRSFKCLSSWPISLLETECFLQLTYLLQRDEVHLVILSVQHMLGSSRGLFERRCKVTPSTVLLFTPGLPSLVLKVSLQTSWWNDSWARWWKGCWSIRQGTKVIRWSIFWHRQHI